MRVVLAAAPLLLSLPACSFVPSEGTIVYHEPRPAAGLAQKKTSALFFVVTTSKDQEVANEGGYQGFAGTIEGADRNRDISQSEWSTAMKNVAARKKPGQTRIVLPAEFQDLWRLLDEAGLFRLPRQAGGEPPETEPYFLVQGGGERWIFSLPGEQVRDSSRALAKAEAAGPGSQDAQVKARLRIWSDSKMAFIGFLNRI